MPYPDDLQRMIQAAIEKQRTEDHTATEARNAEIQAKRQALARAFKAGCGDALFKELEKLEMIEVDDNDPSKLTLRAIIKHAGAVVQFEVISGGPNHEDHTLKIMFPDTGYKSSQIKFCGQMIGSIKQSILLALSQIK